MAEQTDQNQTQQIPNGQSLVNNSDAWSNPSAPATATGPVSAAASPAPAAPRVVAVDPGTPGASATSRSPQLHAFVSSILSAMVGKPPQAYSVDSSGKLVGTPVPETTGDKVRRLVNTFGTGLAAGSQVPRQGSGLANLLAGAGAGFGAESAKESAQDAQKREQAVQDSLRQMNVARANAQNLHLFYDNVKQQNELDPTRAQNQEIADAFRNIPGHSVTTMDADAARAAVNDPSNPIFAHTHLILPAGFKPVTDADGNPVQDASGNYKSKGQVYVIDAMKDGRVPLPASIVSDVQQLKGVGALAAIGSSLDGLQAGQEMDPREFVHLYSTVLSAKTDIQKGWANSELGWMPGPNGTQIPVEINKTLPANDVRSTRPLVAKPIALAAEEGKAAQEKAAAFKDTAEGKKALADAALSGSLLGIGGNSGINQAAVPQYLDAISKLPQAAQTALRNVSPAQQLNLLKVANGDAKIKEVFPSNPRKGSGVLAYQQALPLVSLFRPGWTEELYDTKQQMQKEFSSSKSGAGAGINSFNQLLVHLSEAKQASDNLQRSNSPWINKPLNEIKKNAMGQPGVPELMTAISTARSEWETLIKSNHAPTKDEVALGATLMSDASSPAQILGVARTMGETGVARLDQINEQWKTAWGEDYPNLIHPSAKVAADALGLTNAVSKYRSGGTLGGVVQSSSQSGQANAPAGADQEVYAADGKTLIGHVVNNKFLALGQ